MSGEACRKRRIDDRVAAARATLIEDFDIELNDLERLAEALRHASASGYRAGRMRRSNERLEFLGDRVLGLAVAHRLVRDEPKEDEGDLTKRLVALVRRETLAQIAREIGLDRWLEFAPGERDGATKPAILADAAEALIAAVYLELGYERAAEFVEALIGDRADAMAKPPADPKTQLQEWTQARGFGLPRYDLLRSDGPAHAPTFEVAVRLADDPPALGVGRSKRAAERAAATMLLERLRAEARQS